MHFNAGIVALTNVIIQFGSAEEQNGSGTTSGWVGVLQIQSDGGYRYRTDFLGGFGIHDFGILFWTRRF